MKHAKVKEPGVTQYKTDYTLTCQPQL